LSPAVRIRPAHPADTTQIYTWIIDLAGYEREPDAVTGTPAMLEHSLFGPEPTAEALIAQADGQPAGMALFYRTFSTWECSAGLWLEDLYVPPEYRRAGVGGALIARVAAIAVERGYPRLEWAALDWNTPALRFYEKLGATLLKEWYMHRLEGATLASVARAATAANPPGSEPRN
jgi:GNAT superfamily N-acetyltransferase